MTSSEISEKKRKKNYQTAAHYLQGTPNSFREREKLEQRTTKKNIENVGACQKWHKREKFTHDTFVRNKEINKLTYKKAMAQDKFTSKKQSTRNLGPISHAVKVCRAACAPEIKH